MRLAALDIGSNSVKLLVAEVDAAGHARPVFDEAPISRLAEGLEGSGALTEHAMARTLDTLEGLFERAGVAPGDQPLSAIVTAPGRRARNGAAFVERLRERLGVRALIASAEHEAELGRLATRRAFPELDPLVMIDLGGASTELVRCVGEASEGVVSVDLGAVRLTEGQLPGDPPSAGVIADALAYVRERFGVEARGISGGDAAAVFVSGTATTLASLHLALPRYDPLVVHKARLTRAHLEALHRRLAPLTNAEKRALPGLNPARADVIFAGLLIVEALCDLLGWSEVRVSDQGVRWGLLWELIDRLRREAGVEP